MGGKPDRWNDAPQSPRHPKQELYTNALVDVLLPTRKGVNIRRRCVRKPTEHQAILLARLGLDLPRQIKS